MRGKLISLEGLEGAGKSTQAAKISDYLKTHGIDTVETREPGGIAFGEKIRQILLDPKNTIAPTTELLLFYAARVEHLAQCIEPALARAQWVVCDRFVDSSYAYQGGGRNIPINWIKKLTQLTIPTLIPSITFLLDITPDCIQQRMQGRAGDRFEQEEIAFFERVRNSYLHLAAQEPKRIKVIDAKQSLEQVSEAIIAQLEPLIEAEKK